MIKWEVQELSDTRVKFVVLGSFAQEGRSEFSFTPGFSRVTGSVRRKGKPFKRFPRS